MSYQGININLSQVLFSISLALDIEENRSYEHSRRTAYVAFNIAKQLGLDAEVINKVFYAALIHDIGMTGHLSSHSIESIHYSKELKSDHCYLGSKIVENLPLPKDVSKYILYHHENWDGTGIYGLKGENIPLVSQIISVADAFDIDHSNILSTSLERATIEKWIFDRSGRVFNPIIAKSLLEISKQDKFWLDLKFHNLHQLLDIIKPDEEIIINTDGLKRIANAFAMLIDSKSNFTHRHSEGVARRAKTIATYFEYDDITIKKIEIAGLLHDLGKLVVPNRILNKPSKLTKKEFQIIKSHPYYTKLMLKQINGLEDIAEWAGNHHETLDGNGYPERLNRDKITREDQILAVSDIYQALTEDRPYRLGMCHDEAINILNKMAVDSLISREMISILNVTMKKMHSA